MRRMFSSDGERRAYNSWRAMKDRCHRRVEYKRISVCARWESFDSFYADMGDRPEGKTLERVDYTGDYEPSNCCWATYVAQGRNTRRVKLTEHKARQIRLLDEMGYTQRKIAEMYGVCLRTVESVVAGDVWRSAA